MQATTSMLKNKGRNYAKKVQKNVCFFKVSEFLWYQSFSQV